jgi:hypothetical protein
MELKIITQQFRGVKVECDGVDISECLIKLFIISKLSLFIYLFLRGIQTVVTVKNKARIEINKGVGQRKQFSTQPRSNLGTRLFSTIETKGIG